ncbi:MAG: BRCT domain-containing protein, partial [Planctomycetota bacterium]
SEAGEAAREENEAHSALNNDETRARTEEVFGRQREILDERKKSNRVKDEYRLKSNARTTDDSRDVDGAIFQVDEESGWVWINIGKASDVRLNSTFQVLRADTSNSAEISIGEVRVKELLNRNMARCRVDNLDDPNVYPQQGDLIRNPNYSKRQYQTYALVGDFGGEYSKLTRQQVVDMLRGAGFTVVSTVTGATDALVIGGNWKDDPQFQKAEEERYNLETFTVDDVLYFLGRSSD